MHLEDREMCAKMNEYVVTEVERELEHSVWRVLALSNTLNSHGGYQLTQGLFWFVIFIS